MNVRLEVVSRTMPELDPMPSTYALIADVRRQLLDAAAFGKHLTPDHRTHRTHPGGRAARLRRQHLHRRCRAGGPRLRRLPRPVPPTPMTPGRGCC
ncbi:DUF6374 family protein [Nocardia transvalensis]|uniref:DUF6374 family protein n=1 Tax=Nocardia transvalensis TaxID=37333 RepID=UPI003A5CEA5A